MEEAKPGTDGLECKDGCPEGSHCSGGVCFCNAGNFNVQLFLAFSYHRYWSVKGYPWFFIWLTYRVRIKFKAKYELIQTFIIMVTWGYIQRGLKVRLLICLDVFCELQASYRFC